MKKKKKMHEKHLFGPVSPIQMYIDITALQLL